MTIVERIEKTVAEGELALLHDRQFGELKRFYEAMKASGLVLKREYDLPQLDTIGRGVYTTHKQRPQR